MGRRGRPKKVVESRSQSTLSLENRIPVEMHPHQVRAFTTDKRIILLVAGKQGGKTTLGKYWMAREINEHPADEFLVACPTYKIMGQSTLPRLLEVLNQMNLGEWNEQRKEYKLHAGGRVYVRSTEDPDAIESMKCRAAWLDEAGKMKVKVWYAVNSRVAISKGKILMTTSPYNMGWLYQDVFKKRDDPDYEVIQFASNESPWYPQDEWERQKRTLPEIEFRRSLGGEFLKNEGLVYDCFSRALHTVRPEDIPKNLNKFLGMDIGYAAPTAVVFCGVDKNGIIYIYDEYYKSKGLMSEHASAIFKKGYQKGERIFADKSASQEIAELCSLGLSVSPYKYYSGESRAETFVKIGINKVASLLKSRKLFISKTCKDLIDELETYSWKPVDEDAEVVDKVLKKHDHAVDALRYAILSSQSLIKFAQNPKLYDRPTVQYDELTGEPVGYDLLAKNSLLPYIQGYGTVLLTDGRRKNLITGAIE